MKTSNKILLVFIIASVSFLTGTRLLLYSKYVHNRYAAEKTFNAYYFNTHNLPLIKHAYITGIAQCQVFKAKEPKIMIEKNGSHYASYEVHGDTLFVKGYVADGARGGRLNRSPQDVSVYLPAFVDITAISSNISMQGDTTAANAGLCHVALDNSTLNTRFFLFSDSINRYFDTLYIGAKNRSSIYLNKHDIFNGVNTMLSSSEIYDGRSVINNIKVIADSTSAIIVAGNNINKLNSTAATGNH